MEVKRICALYFSPTDNTRRVVCAAANALAKHYQLPCEDISVTLPQERVEYSFGEGDLVVIGAPTYAGKLPNKMLPYFQSGLHGNGALAVAVVTYGNRSFDNSLAELCAVLEADGFHTAAGGAFVGTHAFSDALAPGRPGEDDLREIDRFAAEIAEKLERTEGVPTPVAVAGNAAAPYYVPKGTDGAPAKFLKAAPKTDPEKCTRCGLCASQCPMGSISADDPSVITGVCIKCQSCIRKCPQHAKYFDDAAFLSHVRMLEQNFTRRAENKTFL